MRVTLRREVARQRLAALGLTQSSLAAVLQVELRTLQRWFAGQAVRLEDAERVAAALQLGTGELFHGAPEQGMDANVARVRALVRLLSTRDSVVARVLRAMLQDAAFYLDVLLFGPPTHGFVYELDAPHARHAFARFRVHGAGSASFRLYDSPIQGLCVERARGRLGPRDVLLVEVLHTRSMSAPLAPDGSFELWVWMGPDSHKLVLCADNELTSTPLPSPQDPALFDMASPAAAHAVCVRPVPSHLRAAGHPAGFDRVLHRDAARADAPHERI